MNSQHLKIGFLASGSGSSARAIVAALESGELAGEARLMVSNNRSAPALEFARAKKPTLPSSSPEQLREGRLSRERKRKGRLKPPRPLLRKLQIDR